MRGLKLPGEDCNSLSCSAQVQVASVVLLCKPQKISVDFTPSSTLEQQQAILFSMVDVQSAPIEEKTEPAPPALPDFLLSPNAVFKDEGAQWRYGRPPDYSKTRKVWEEGELNARKSLPSASRI